MQNYVRKGRIGGVQAFLDAGGVCPDAAPVECNCSLCYAADVAMRRAANERVLARRRARRVKSLAYGDGVTWQDAADAVEATLDRLEARVTALLPVTDGFAVNGLAVAALRA
jgi:hypothetical protein